MDTAHSKLQVNQMGEIIRTVFDYWNNLGEGHDLPLVSMFDPLELAEIDTKAVPHLWLIDVERNPLRFRYRLIGGELKNAGCKPLAGDYVDERCPTGELHRYLQGVCETRHPWYRKGPPIISHDNQISELESLIAPLFDEADEVSRLLCCTVFSWSMGFAKPSL